MPPSLTVRSFAEMLDLPLYEQLRIIEEQKYPTKAPASFRVPYYRTAIAAIRRFYDQGRQNSVLDDAIADLQASGLPQSRIENNVRVIRSFRQSPQARRQLTPRQGIRLRQTLTGVELKFNPDLVGVEGQEGKYILYNPRQAPLTVDLARTTLELVHWILHNSGLEVELPDLEYVDLASHGRVHRIQRVRAQTVRRAQQNARAIRQIWDGI